MIVLLPFVQNRRTDDTQRPHDLSADIGFSIADMVLGIGDGDEEDSLLLTAEERRIASTSTVGLSFSKLLTSDSRCFWLVVC